MYFHFEFLKYHMLEVQNSNGYREKCMCKRCILMKTIFFFYNVIKSGIFLEAK